MVVKRVSTLMSSNFLTIPLAMGLEMQLLSNGLSMACLNEGLPPLEVLCCFAVHADQPDAIHFQLDLDLPIGQSPVDDLRGQDFVNQ